MQDMFTRILGDAVRLEGSEQALATRLRVPGSTLSRWLRGRAQTPLGAFLVTLQFVMQKERAALGERATLPVKGPQEKLVFPLGTLTARCARCGAIEFRARDAGSLSLASVLHCAQCGADVVHGELLAQLARGARRQSRGHHAHRLANDTQQDLAE